MARDLFTTPHPVLSLPFSTQSEGPVPGSADEAVTTSCQVSPFIVRNTHKKEHILQPMHKRKELGEKGGKQKTPRFSNCNLRPSLEHP